MTRHPSWHGRGYTVGDLASLVNALKLLKQNEWHPETPLCFDGSGYLDCSVRESAAILLLNALAGNNIARKLYFQNADLDLKAQKAFADVFLKNSTMTIVSLTDLRFNDNPMAIPHTLFGNKQLMELNISKCLLDDMGCALLGSMLALKASSLASLSLVKIVVSTKGMADICAGLKNTCTLRTLNLRRIDLEMETKPTLLRALRENASIMSLVIDDMDLRSVDARGLARMLACNATVETLSLRRNKLDGKAIRVLLAHGLQKNQTLVTETITQPNSR